MSKIEINGYKKLKILRYKKVCNLAMLLLLIFNTALLNISQYTFKIFELLVVI